MYIHHCGVFDLLYHPNNKFESKYVGALIDNFSKGKSLARFLADAEVTKQTFYNWLDRYPGFKEAYAIALLKGEAYHQDRLDENLGNPDFQFGVAKFIMSNRYGVTANRKQRAHKWLKTKDLVGSFDRLIKMYKDEDVDISELKEGVDLLLNLATLKERTELEERVAQLEKNLREQDEQAER